MLDKYWHNVECWLKLRKAFDFRKVVEGSYLGLSFFLFSFSVYKNKITAVESGCVTAVLKAISDNGDCGDIILSGLKTICNVIEIGML